MSKVTVLCGVSGSGKTHFRTHSEKLSTLPVVDIADIYRQYPHFDWYEALHTVISRVEKLLRQNEHIVVEGYFLPGTASRTVLQRWLHRRGWGDDRPDVEWVWFHVPLHTCIKRLEAQLSVAQSPTLRREVLKRIEMTREIWPKAHRAFGGRYRPEVEL